MIKRRSRIAELSPFKAQLRLLVNGPTEAQTREEEKKKKRRKGVDPKQNQRSNRGREEEKWGWPNQTISMQAQPTPSQPNHGQKRVNEKDEIGCLALAQSTLILNPTKGGEEKEQKIKCQPN